ncbi:MAG: YveK family protein [Chloroflexaceae bacterium]
MQLRYYFSILRRFWMLTILLPLIVGALSLLLLSRQPVQYGASARVLVTQTPRQQDPTATDLPDFNLQYSWSSSEYIVDDLPQVIRSAAFAQDVSAWADEQGYDIAPELVQGSLSSETLHRSVTFSAVTSNPEMAVALLRGVIAVLQENGLEYWNRTTPTGNGLSVAVLDPPEVAVPLGSNRDIIIDVALRMVLALATGVGVALLLHYLDDTLRDANQVEDQMGLPVVGMIPRE